MTQSNVEILRAAYAAFAQGDVPAVLAVFDENITWHVPGRNPISGDYTGPDEVLGFFQVLVEGSGGTFHLDVADFLDSGGETVAVVVTEHGERNGNVRSDSAVHVWQMRDGKAVGFQGFQGDDHDFDEFWS